jgi:hypothetical protein
MPLLKRKPVIYRPLPSLATILQPIASSSKDTDSTPPPPLGPNGAVPKSKKSKKADVESELGDDDKPASSSWVPPDMDNDADQLKLLSRVFEEGFTTGSVGKGKKAGTWIVNGSVNIYDPDQPDGGKAIKEEDAIKAEEDFGNGSVNGNGTGGEMLPPPVPTESWKITDREVFYIPETGEIFTDYE